VPTITYSADGFPATYGPALVGSKQLSVSWAEIIWAAISVGRGSLSHLTQYGVFSVFEITYRAALIYANLRESPSGILTRSSAYDGLDPSEKGAVSYFVGITLAKLFANRLLSVPWLLHLDVYRQQLQPILAGKSKPDFVGLNAAYDWVVLEAKGRTNEYEDSVLQRAKSQTQQLTTIQGNQPVLRAGSLAYFSAGNLQFAIRDPKGEDGREKIRDLPLSKDALIRAYYRLFQAWFQEATSVQTEEIEGRRYRLLALPDFELSIGLPLDMEERLIALEPAKEQRLREDNEFIGADGLLVRVGTVWSSEKMRLEPQARFRA
jgi:hypothetical protein